MDSLSAYEALLGHSPDLLAVLADTGELRFASERTTAVLGYDPEALVGTPVLDYVHPEDEAAVLAVGRRLAEGESESDGETVEVRVEHADGSWCWLEASLSGERVESLGGYVVACRPIGERKSAERSRSDILDRMTDGFFATDTDWNVTYANAAGKDLLGRAMGFDPETETIVGRNLWAEVPEAVETTFYEKYTEALDTGNPVTFEEYYEPLDTWFSVHTFPSEHGLSVYFRDVTERRRRETALAHRERFLREMHGVTADRDTSFTEKIEALLSLGREHVGTDYATLSHINGDEYVFEVVDAETDDIAAGDVVPVEATNCELVATDRQTLVAGDVAQDLPEETDRAGYTEWGISCYLGAPVFVDGEVYGTFCFYDTDPRTEQFSDWEVTIVDLLAQWASYELQREATTRQLTEQNRRLDRFASIVSHDLRNPLNVLDGRLQMARETGAAEHFDDARLAVERMETLIGDLLSLARAGMELEEIEPIDLRLLLEESWELVRTDEATLAVDEDLDGEFTADKSRVSQLLENLLRNAIDHGGGDVRIEVGPLPAGFYVEDDGPGIPSDERDSVFEWGYSTEEEGTGLGLGIVRGVAEAHGWDVTVTDGGAGGARFEITGLSRPVPVNS